MQKPINANMASTAVPDKSLLHHEATHSHGALMSNATSTTTVGLSLVGGQQ